MEGLVDNPDSPVVVTDSNINEAIAKYPFLLVDCWAEWCGPCKMMGPVLDKLAKEHQGDIVFAKLDVDSNKCDRSKVWYPFHTRSSGL